MDTLWHILNNISARDPGVTWPDFEESFLLNSKYWISNFCPDARVDLISENSENETTGPGAPERLVSGKIVAS